MGVKIYNPKLTVLKHSPILVSVKAVDLWSKEVLNRLRMYGNGYSMAIVLDHRSTATSLTGNWTYRFEVEVYLSLLLFKVISTIPDSVSESQVNPTDQNAYSGRSTTGTTQPPIHMFNCQFYSRQ